MFIYKLIVSPMALNGELQRATKIFFVIHCFEALKVGGDGAEL